MCKSSGMCVHYLLLRVWLRSSTGSIDVDSGKVGEDPSSVPTNDIRTCTLHGNRSGCLFRGCNPCCYFCQPHPHRVSCAHQDDGMCQEEHRENELCFSSFSPLDSSSGPSDPKRGRSQNKRFWARPSTSQLYFVVAYFMNCRCGGHAIFRVYLV